LIVAAVRCLRASFGGRDIAVVEAVRQRGIDVDDTVDAKGSAIGH